MLEVTDVCEVQKDIVTIIRRWSSLVMVSRAACHLYLSHIT